MPADFSHVEIWRSPQKKNTFQYKGIFIPRSVACSATEKDMIENRHPAAKFIVKLYKGDCLVIIDPTTDRHELCIVTSFSPQDNRLNLQPISASHNIQTWMMLTNTRLTSAFWPRDCKAQYYKSINVLFTDFKVEIARISVDGRLSIRSL